MDEDCSRTLNDVTELLEARIEMDYTRVVEDREGLVEILDSLCTE